MSDMPKASYRIDVDHIGDGPKGWTWKVYTGVRYPYNPTVEGGAADQDRAWSEAFSYLRLAQTRMAQCKHEWVPAPDLRPGTSCSDVNVFVEDNRYQSCLHCGAPKPL